MIKTVANTVYQERNLDDALYRKLSPGGYIIVDDFGALPSCRRAVKSYREQHDIASEIHKIDWTGVWWRKDQ